jgi:hypothetical protein
MLLMAGAALAGPAGAGAGPGVLVSPEEATAARGRLRLETTPLQDGRRVHRVTFPDGAVVSFTDRPRRPTDAAQRAYVVSHVGEHPARDEPEETFRAAGAATSLSPEAVAALRFISRHEGGFDAINTWDGARFSWGFIQFAGGYGLRPMLAHLQAASPALFQAQLGAYGVSVQPGEDGRPEPVLVRAAGEPPARGAAAEQAIGDDPLLIALFIRAGQLPEVKQRQIEAAIRDYALPALRAPYGRLPLSALLSTPQGLAALIDRQVHDGNVDRLRWSFEHARLQAGLPPESTAEELRALHGRVLDLATRDADARAVLFVEARRAADELSRGETSAAEGEAAGALAAARALLVPCLWQVQYRMVVSPLRDRLREACSGALATTEPDVSPDARLRAAAELRAATARLTYEHLVRNRLRSIRGSELPGPPPTSVEPVPPPFPAP